MNLRLHQSARVGLGVVASFAIATVATAWIGHDRSPALCTDCELTAHPPPIIAPPTTDTRSQFPVASSYANRLAASAVPVVAELTAPIGMISTDATAHHSAEAGRARDDRFAPARLEGASAAHGGGGGGGAASHIGGSGGGGGGMGASSTKSVTTNHISTHSPSHTSSSHASSSHGVAHSAVAAGNVTPAAVSTVAASMVATTPAAVVSPVFSQDTVAPSQVAFARSTIASVAGGGGLASIGGGGSLSATPEPGTLILMLTGTLGILRWRRFAR